MSRVCNVCRVEKNISEFIRKFTKIIGIDLLGKSLFLLKWVSYCMNCMYCCMNTVFRSMKNGKRYREQK